MARPRQTRPTDGELEILKIIWGRGDQDSTVRDIHDVMIKSRTVAPTTVDKRMRSMVEKKLLVIVDDRRPARFKAAIAQNATYDSLFKDLVRRVGSPTQLVMHLLKGGKMTSRERQLVQEQLDKMG